MPLPKELSFMSGAFSNSCSLPNSPNHAKFRENTAYHTGFLVVQRTKKRQLLVSPDVFVSKSASTSTCFQRLKETSMLPVVGTAPKWSSGRPSSTLRRGVRRRDAALACTTTAMGVTTLSQNCSPAADRRIVECVY